MDYGESAGIEYIGPLPDGFDITGMSAKPQWLKAPNGTYYWLISDYKLARGILSDPRFRRSDAARPDAPRISAHNPAANAIISVDGEAHARLRSIVAPAFTERRIAGLAPFIGELVDDLLNGLADQPMPADFVSNVSALLPFATVCHLLGVPPEDREIFGSWVNLLFRWDGVTDIGKGQQQRIGLTRYMTDLVAAKRVNPGDDLISDLIRSAEQEGNATDRELVTLCLSLLMAGYDSTIDQISLCVLTVILDRSLITRIRSDPECSSQVAEELLRLNPAPYMTFPRMTAEPVTVGGVTIRPGELVVISIIGSNRDSKIFTSADEIVCTRAAPSHLTFGYGMHRCLGAPLARLQLALLLSALARRFPQLRLADREDALAWKSGMTRGLSRTLVCWC